MSRNNEDIEHEWACSNCGHVQRHEGCVCLYCLEQGRPMLKKWAIPNPGAWMKKEYDPEADGK